MMEKSRLVDLFNDFTILRFNSLGLLTVKEEGERISILSQFVFNLKLDSSLEKNK